MLSCLDDADCTVDSTNIVIIDFKKKSSLEADTLQIESVVLENTDSVFYKAEDRTAIAIPINAGATSFPIEITLDDGVILGLTLEYQVVPRLISEDCGIEFKIEQLTVGDHNFDSVAVINALLEQEITTNIEVYR